jgi:hypothetical protein
VIDDAVLERESDHARPLADVRGYIGSTRAAKVVAPSDVMYSALRVFRALHQTRAELRSVDGCLDLL